ncbi:MAG: hypothetical protein JWL84_2931 [Rhodospirillales bacterium]|jgi:hypothetical protein|nr:hypothetical protein [Rhodospirillales bacterium]
MKERLWTTIARRDLLRAMMTAAAATTAGTVAVEASAATSESSGDKRKARYRADSAEVKDFYRVNRYPAK